MSRKSATVDVRGPRSAAAGATVLLATHGSRLGREFHLLLRRAASPAYTV